MLLRIKYGKNNKGRFLSHLDLMRAWERALRRAEIPLAFSQGFNPHPKISYGSALAVGLTSSGEYLDLELKNYLSLKEIKGRLEKYLPEGLDVFEVIELDEKAKPLMAAIDRAKYVIEAELKEELSQRELNDYLEKFLEQVTIVVWRETKKGKKEKNIREGISELSGEVLAEGMVRFSSVVQTGSQGNVRPEEIINSLKEFGLPLNNATASINREGLYINTDEGLKTPLSVIS